MWDPLKQGAFRASQKEFGQQPVNIQQARSQTSPLSDQVKGGSQHTPSFAKASGFAGDTLRQNGAGLEDPG